tara:strand:+ start:208 stop:780 length:573 start_codon:yes stop_codon:yes gene_type:complete
MTLESDLIRRYRGAFSSQDCEDCIKYIDQFDKNNLLTYDTEKLNEVDNKTINLTHSYNLASYSYLADLILPKFKPCIDEYIEAVSILRDYKFLTYDLKIKKIPMGGGFHSWHFENGSLPYSQRKFVIQLYLNDNFEGGETEFLYQNRRELPKQGDVLIFPAGFTHTHRGNPPIDGDKYLITSWGLTQDHD